MPARPCIAVCCLLLACALPAAELPSLSPQVSSVFPHGVQKGKSVRIELRGSQLDGVTQLLFPDGQLHATIESASFRSVIATVAAPDAAETGLHEFRLVSTRGVAFGMLAVGSLPESAEAEPNDRAAQANRVTLPALINGRADGADADYFRFHAETGQTIVFDVASTRLGSALDPVITLFDDQGREIGYNDDAYIFKDARLIHTFAHAGDYTVLVSASFERSARDAEYRLLITSDPIALSALPLGARQGSTVQLSLQGSNLAKAERLWLDQPSTEATITSRSADRLSAKLTLPATLAAGPHQLHLASSTSESPVPIRFEISDQPETTIPLDSTATFDHPFPTSVPVIVNGAMPASPNAMQHVQWIEFRPKPGGRYEFRVDAWKLGLTFDPVVTLTNLAGKVLAEEDDPAPNSFIHHPASHDPRLVYVFPDAGPYRVQVRDAAYQTGNGGYRLSIREVKPSFEVEVRTPQLTLYRGKEATLLTVVRRTGGVHKVEPFRKPDSEIEHFRIIESDGWSTPINVSVEGLPQGITAIQATAEPKNTIFKGNDGEELFVDGALAEIPLRAAASTPPGLYEVTVRGTGAFNGRSVTRSAAILNGAMRAYRSTPTLDQKLLLNILDTPPIVWNVPAEVSLSKGAPTRVKAGLVRMAGSFPITVDAKLPSGCCTAERATARPSDEEVELTITASSAPDAGRQTLVLVGAFEHNGRTERIESPPIELRIKP